MIFEHKIVNGIFYYERMGHLNKSLFENPQNLIFGIDYVPFGEDRWKKTNSCSFYMNIGKGYGQSFLFIFGGV